MNLSIAIFLVNKAVRPVRVSYDPNFPKNNNPDAFFKTLDPSIKIGDKVVVPTTTRHGMTVCKVEDVDFRVNFDSTTDYKWVIGKVDVPAYDDIIKQELKVLDRIGDAEENRKRAELVKALQIGEIDLTDLDIVGGTPAIPAPPSPRGQPAAAEQPKAYEPAPAPTSGGWTKPTAASDDIPF